MLRKEIESYYLGYSGPIDPFHQHILTVLAQLNESVCNPELVSQLQDYLWFNLKQTVFSQLDDNPQESHDLRLSDFQNQVALSYQ